MSSVAEKNQKKGRRNVAENKPNVEESAAAIEREEIAAPTPEENVVVEKAPEENLAVEKEPEAPVVESEAVLEEVSASERLIEALANGEKPWFLTSSEVYKVVKKAVSSIPNGGAVFERSLTAISLLTKYINESTRFNVVLDVEQSHVLINQIDNILSEQLVFVDDGLDKFRGELSMKLRLLLSAISKNKLWAEERARTAGDAVKTSYNTTYTKAASRYEQFVVVLQNLVETVKERYSGVVGMVAGTVIATKVTAEELVNFAKTTVTNTYKKSLDYVQETVDASKAKATTTVIDTLSFYLKKYQPLVVDAVQVSQPYVLKALAVSQPYVEKAKPFVDPLVEKAKNVNATLLDNAVVGPYVSKAYDLANVAINETKVYCHIHSE